MSVRTLHVAVAVIRNDVGCVLVTQRLPHQHLAGFWEFPGGKLEPGETLAEGMRREIHEELGIVVEQLAPLLRVEHRYFEKGYPEKIVLLDVWRITRWSGVPVGREGQPLRWVHPEDMLPAEFPPADVPIIAALRLPAQYLISPDIQTQQQADAFVAQVVSANILLVQVRLDAVPMLAPRLIAALRAAAPQVRILINSRTLSAITRMRIDRTQQVSLDESQRESPQISLCGADGIHLAAQDLRTCTERPSAFAAASCHDAGELRLAHALSLDFATLSPVLATTSHPDAVPLGWPVFAEQVRDAGLPVFALGGMHRADLPQALVAGAVGIAGISGLLDDC